MADILVIDDDRAYLESMRRTLEEAGHRVRLADHARKGLLSYLGKPADLVIVDILMPGRDGLQAIRDLRWGDPDAKVLAISGAWRLGKGDVLDVARRLGVMWTLPKPFSDEEMLAAVDAALGAGAPGPPA